MISYNWYNNNYSQQQYANIRFNLIGKEEKTAQ